MADPYVIRAGSRYYMFYLGMDRARRQRLGVAASDDGVSWYKLRNNPILELGDYGAFDANGTWRAGGVGFAWILLDAVHRTRSAVRCAGSVWRVRATASAGKNCRW